MTDSSKRTKQGAKQGKTQGAKQVDTSAKRDDPSAARGEAVDGNGAAAQRAPAFRIGQGYDVHALVPGRKLILAGVQVPSAAGLLGHSDADVLTHAIIDALLGAAALGDIGTHFPDTNPKYRGADSIELLRHAVALVRKAGYAIGNVDCTVIAQAPRLAASIPKMVERLAQALQVDSGAVNVKAKTNERLGHLGRGEGIAAQAIVLLTG